MTVGRMPPVSAATAMIIFLFQFGLKSAGRSGRRAGSD